MSIYAPPNSAINTATATVTTQETTTSTTYTDLATTTDTVTVNIGPSGVALVIVSCGTFVGTNGAQTYMSFAVSGANTASAADSKAVAFGIPTVGAGMFLSASRIITLTGLSSGSTTFKAKYRTTAGTGTFSNRDIAVVPL